MKPYLVERSGATFHAKFVSDNELEGRSGKPTRHEMGF